MSSFNSVNVPASELKILSSLDAPSNVSAPPVFSGTLAGVSVVEFITALSEGVSALTVPIHNTNKSSDIIKKYFDLFFEIISFLFK